MKIILSLTALSLPPALSITCYQCASTEGNSCPAVAKTFTSGNGDLTSH